jgi:TRAP-type C4-dicarboxylate transport system permease small subunit
MKNFNKLLEYFVSTLMILMTVIVLMQIIFREFFNISIFWTFEVSSFMFTWIIFLGAAIGFMRKSHFSISLMVEKFSPKIIKFFDNFVIIVVTIFLVVVIKYGLDLMISTRYQISPSLRVPMSIIYSVIPFGSSIMLLYFWIYRKNKKKGKG